MTGLPVSATIPAQSLVGNPTTQAGPQQAIPYATLAAIVMGTIADTSTSSLTIGTGTQTIQASVGKSFAPGMFLVVANSANAAQFMSGIVTSYNATTGVLILNCLSTSGSGTFSSWNISLSGPQGAQGSTPNLRSFLAGFTLSNDGTSPNTVLDVAAGQCADSTNAVLINGTAFTKSISGAWVAGTGQNGMGVGLTATASTWYHVFAIINNTNYDVYFDTSITGANAPAGTTALRRLGSIKLDGSVHILAFVQFGDEFLWKTGPTDVSVTSQTTSAVLYTLSVPPGIQTRARVRTSGGGPASAYSVLLTSPDETDQAPSISGVPYTFLGAANATNGAEALVRTNTSQQIRARASAALSSEFQIQTYGWFDDRGKPN